MIELRDYQHEGYTSINESWKQNDNVLYVLPTGGGKEQPYSEPVLTPNGWSTMGKLNVGEEVIDADGLPTTITGIFEQGVKDVYKVTFRDGSSTRCGLHHLWNVTHPDWNSDKTLPLIEIIKKYKKPIKKNYRNSGYSKRVAVKLCKPIAFSEKELPLHPYVMGLLLGDGSFRYGNIRFTDYNGVEASRLEKLLPGNDKLSSQGNGEDYLIKGGVTKKIITDYELDGKYSVEKHIPEIYLRGSINQRKELLNGLLDTDGYWNKPTLNEYSTSSPQLMKDIVDLARGLGHSVSITTRQSKWTYKGERKTGRDTYRIYISFNITKKTIWNIEKLGTENSRCIKVDNKDSLYITKDFTVTHNTVVISEIIRNEKGGSCVIAHRQELVSQISIALAKNDIYHNIVGPVGVVKMITLMHRSLFGKSFYRPHAKCAVAGIDTLIRRGRDLKNWLPTVKLWINDEAHHLLEENKWGKGVNMFPNARGLGVTATPLRADGKGLGRHSDGLMDDMIVGPSMRELINRGFLTEYKIFAPKSNLRVEDIKVSKVTGDLNQKELRKATFESSLIQHDESKITGDVVKSYLRFAPGKLGVTFVPDMITGEEIVKQFIASGVSAVLVNAKTPDNLRAETLKKFAKREIMQLVNVDLFGEGFDLPAIEVICMARATASYGLFVQMFGRVLRLLKGKERGIIIDHVGNILQRHGLPDAPRFWSLDSVPKRKSKQGEDGIEVKVCPECTVVYERYLKTCPHCDYLPKPVKNETIEQVDGDLVELSPEILARLRGEVDKINRPHTEQLEEYRRHLQAKNVPQIGGMANVKRMVVQLEHQTNSQVILRDKMAWWAGHRRGEGLSDDEIFKLFYIRFNIDWISAQALPGDEADTLIEKVDVFLERIL